LNLKATGKVIVPLRVVHFNRKPRLVGNHSIETYYKQIREQAPANISITSFVSKYESSGLFKRLYNVVEAFFHQGDINHVTGDVHFLTLLLKKKKTILTVLDCGMLKDNSGWKRTILKLCWFDLPISRVSYITAISESTKNDLLEVVSFPGERVKVIYVCVSDIFRPATKVFNENEPRILQIGTASNKNLERTIRALKEIPCTLVIIGKEVLTTEQLLKENNIKYEWHKHMLTEEQVYKEYIKADIVSFVSTLEGFGMPIVEANATGRVVITGNTTSMPEVAGNAALIVDPFDVAAIRDGLLKLITDATLRDTLIKNGFENIKRFSKEKIVKEHYELYRQVYAEGEKG
jgi:glycosyltransferase involved in cell wall biosynthesis